MRGRSERQVDHPDVVTELLIHDPLNAANDVEVGPLAGTVQNSHGDEVHTGRDTLVVAGGRYAAAADDRGHVRAVTVGIADVGAVVREKRVAVGARVLLRQEYIVLGQDAGAVAVGGGLQRTVLRPQA